MNALVFVDADGKKKYFRYRVVPDAGEENVDEAALKEKSDSYLYEELSKRVAEGNTTSQLKAQIAEDGDVVDDGIVHWPESRKLVTLGAVNLEKMVPDTQKEQKHIIYDPIPRVKGIEPSADPLLELRAAMYLLSGTERRAA